MKPVRLVIVDDARFVREALSRLLAADDRIQVVATAGTGEELLAQFDEWRPDAVTLDIDMPGLGGLATLDRLTARSSVPVIIMSTHSGAGAPITIEALSHGAADFIDKEAFSLVDFAALREVLVARLLHVTGRLGCEAAPVPPVTPPVVAGPTGGGPVRLVVMGASTGGPRALEGVLRALGAVVPAPVLIAQHMPDGFTRAFAERLNRSLPLDVAEARDDESLRAGMVRIAPGGRHLMVALRDGALCTIVRDEPAAALHKPGVDVLFRSAARVTADETVAVLLTGMGTDGAAGMGELAAAGAWTIAQDEASCVVYGMPRAAVVAGAARDVLPLDAIGARVRNILRPAVAGVTL